jgi:hypothetical protein
MARQEPNRKAVSRYERGVQCLAVALCAALVAVQLVKAELRLPAEHRLDTLEAQYAMVVLADPPALEIVPVSLAVAAEALVRHMACRSGRWWWPCLNIQSVVSTVVLPPQGRD